MRGRRWGGAGRHKAGTYRTFEHVFGGAAGGGAGRHKAGTYRTFERVCGGAAGGGAGRHKAGTYRTFEHVFGGAAGVGRAGTRPAPTGHLSVYAGAPRVVGGQEQGRHLPDI